MNKFFLFILVSALFVACGSSKKEGISTDDIKISESAEGNGDKSNLPVMVFAEDKHDFGRITQGEKVSFSFKFKNEGKSNLIISSAQGSCGCTVAQPPKEPIAPGKEGSIDVVFNSDGKAGKIDKTVTVLTNCEPNTKILTIYADVIVPAETEPNPNKSK
jgi:hypothetical protein